MPKPPKELAAEIVERILDDLRGRSGIDGAFDAIDESIQEEIRRDLEEITFESLVGI